MSTAAPEAPRKRAPRTKPSAQAPTLATPTQPVSTETAPTEPVAQAPASPTEPPEKRRKRVKAETHEKVQAAQAAAETVASLPNPVQRVADALESLPTPGGLIVLLSILLIFLFAIVPVTSTGKTRLRAFWDVLRGRMTLEDPAGMAATQQAANTNAILTQTIISTATNGLLGQGITDITNPTPTGTGSGEPVTGIWQGPSLAEPVPGDYRYGLPGSD